MPVPQPPEQSLRTCSWCSWSSTCSLPEYIKQNHWQEKNQNFPALSSTPNVKKVVHLCCSTYCSGKFAADHPWAAKGRPPSKYQWLLLPRSMALVSGIMLSTASLVQNERALGQKKGLVVSSAPKAMGSMNQVMATSEFPRMWMLEHPIRILNPSASVCTLSFCSNQNEEWAWGEGDIGVLIWTQKLLTHLNPSIWLFQFEPCPAFRAYPTLSKWWHSHIFVENITNNKMK